MKRTLSLVLACILALGTFFAGSAAFAEDTVYKKGDIIEFGSYPQTRVTDEETLAALFDLRITWQSYGYYGYAYPFQNVETGMQQIPYDHMKYADVEMNGVQYRAVRFTENRPERTDLTWGSTWTNQIRNGYSKETTYWFRYEPLHWRVLDPAEQLVIADSIIDAQPYSNTCFYAEDGKTYKDYTCTVDSRNYEYSSIRAFLNDISQENGFANLAFTEDEWSVILTTHLDNRDDAQQRDRTGEDTDDKVFLPSLDLANDTWYWAGQHAANEEQMAARQTLCSDYAACQGLYAIPDTDRAGYLLRTMAATPSSGIEYAVDYSGAVSSIAASLSINYGVRPAMRIDLTQLTGKDEKPLSGTCGENVQWAFDEESGVLSLSGTGAMDSLDAFDDYGYSVWKDDMQFVAAADGVTSIGAHAFEGCSTLEEVILGEDVTQIGEAAFADCPRLMNVTLLSNTISADGAFPDDRMDWMLIFPDQNTQAIALAKRYGVSWITVSYADDVLSFGGTITVHDGYAYSYLPMFIQRYGSAQKVYFNRLVFADVRAKDVEKQDYTGSTTDGCLTMFYVEVTLVYISPDGDQREVTYDQMIELLQSGDYRAFKLRVSTPTGDDEEKTQEEIIYEKLEGILPFMPRKVLRIVSKAINFIVSIFKKK